MAAVTVSPRFVLALAAAALLSAACHRGMKPDYKSLGLAEVTGTVTLDGKPLPGAYVVFENENGTFSFGTTDGSGRYRLMYNSEQAGISPGTKRVRITGRSISDEEDAAAPEGDPLPARYHAATELVREVKPGRQTHHFELVSP